MKCPNCETEFTGAQCPQCGFVPAREAEQEPVSPENSPPVEEAPAEAALSSEDSALIDEETAVPDQASEPEETQEPESEDTTEPPAEESGENTSAAGKAGRPGRGLFGSKAAKPDSPAKEKPPKKKLLVPLIAAAVVILLILIAAKAVPAILEKQHKAWLLTELANAQETKAANLTVKLPLDWQHKEPDAKNQTVYTFEALDKKGRLIANVCLEDFGRQDDNIKAGEAIKNLLPAGAEEVSSTDSMKLDGCKAHYREMVYSADGVPFHGALALVEADQTWFVYSMAAQEEYYTPEAVDQFLGNADFSAYKTPAVTALEADYSGSAQRDTRITKDTKGLKVTATYSDGSSRDVTKKIELQPVGEGATDVLMAEKTSEFEVSYGGKKAKLSIECASKWKNMEVSYTGETKAGTAITPETKGLKVTATFNDGAEDITKKCEVTPVGEGVTNVLQADRTTEFEVSYQGKSRPLSIECSTKLEKLEASYTGETKAGTVINKDTKGFSVKATFNEGEQNVTAECKITGPEKLEAGQTARYTIEYGGKSCTLDIQCTTMSEAQYKAQCGTFTYDQLARNPDDHQGKKIKFSGKVLQAGGDYYRVAMGGNYNTVIFVTDERNYAASHLSDPNGNNGFWGWGATDGKDYENILEDDWITVYGECNGTKTYTSVLGASITIPEVAGFFISR